MGDKDSSRTRVQPIFNRLLEEAALWLAMD